MRSHTLLVLGSNSFAGGCLVRKALEQGHKVIGINRSAEGGDEMVPYKLAGINQNYQFHQLDLNQNFQSIIELIRHTSPDWVADLSGQGMVAESWKNPEQWYQTNIVAKSKLIQFLATETDIKKYVRASTPEVYGSTNTLITESNCYNPSTPYAISHAAIDMHIAAYVNQFSLPAVLTRFSNFYGPTQQLYRIIPKAIIFAKLGKKLPLHGGGLATRAFIYGDDAAAGILAALELGRVGETYHFSTDSFVTIRQLVETVYQIMAIDFDSAVEMSSDRPGKDMKYLMDDSKARQDLCWTPKTSLVDGITQTIRWIETHWQYIKDQPFHYIHKV